MAPTVIERPPRPSVAEPVAPSGPLRAPTWAPSAGLLLLVILTVGLAVRLVDLDASPLGFHPSRQYRAAVISREILRSETRPADDAARLRATSAVTVIGDLEPPITETLTATIWRVTGENLLVPRLVGIASWLGGAVAAWGILGRLGTRAAQVVGTTTFVLIPMGVAASRSFQPDAPMVALALVAVAAALRAEEAGSRRWWAVAVAMAAAAVLVKVSVAPMVLAALAAVVVAARGLRALVRLPVAMGAAAVVGPTLLYYARSAGAQDTAGDWVGASFLPRMFVEADAYVMAWHTIDRAVPLGLVALGLLGVALQTGRARLVLVALGAGHLATCVMVNYRAATHDYYHLPLVALVALGLGLGADQVGARLRRSELPEPIRRGVVALGVSVLALFAVGFVTGTGRVEASIGTGARHEAIAARIGELTRHQGVVIAVSNAYGVDLAYQGEVTAVEFPGPADIALLERQGLPAPTLADVQRRWDGDWFAVTNMATYEALPDLRAELRTEHALVARGDGWMLWRLSDR